ncbi:MAG: sortase family protein [Anaerosolibacter sp.]|uniref:sortase n=1 Tax=Anaerosolibacter sp. TaxID=1872527 RepID=UPI00261BB3AE|nr:class E sortase [Anaerosolibacter sp.]MDF2546936.1 sortase family protein [Anaerosolibacter sp.]
MLKFIKYKWRTILIVLGSVLLIYAVISVHQWRILQTRLIEEKEKVGETPIISEEPDIPVLEAEKEEQETPVSNQVQEAKQIKRGDYQRGEMVIHIPKINVNAAVMEGTTGTMLKKGPGLYEISPLPSDDNGNVCIAGHRTTYGAWFRHVDQLEKGDEIALQLEGQTYLYKVEKVFIVEKNDWSVTEPTGYAVLTLTSCHPLRSSRQRIVVRAKREKVTTNSQ